MRALLLSTLVIAATSLPSVASAATSELPSAFFVSKSENKNQVHYAVRIDDACRPTGATPVRAYWKLLERSPGATAPLLSREQGAYGIASQSVTDRADAGGTVLLSLRALPERPLRITTGRDAEGACRAWAYMPISGPPAHLYNIHVVLKFLGVDSILLTGWTTSNGRVVRERLEP